MIRYLGNMDYTVARLGVNGEMSDKTGIKSAEQPEEIDRVIDFMKPNEANGNRTEHLLQEALDTFPDHVILYDRNDRVVFTNDRYHIVYPHLPPKDKINGYTQEQLLRVSLDHGLIDDPLAKSDPDTWVEMMIAKGHGKKNLGRVTGESTDSSGRSYMYRKRQTSEGGLVLVQTDITERKQAEKSSQQLTTAIVNLEESIAIYDADNRLVFWNAAYEKHHEGELQELLKPGLKLEDLVRARAYSGEAPEAIGQEEAYIARRMEKHRNPGQQFETQRKNGWFVYRESPTPDGGIIIVITDITNIKHAEELKAQSDLIELLQKIAVDSNKATDFFGALRACLSTVIEFTGWPVGHVYCVPENSGDHMVSSNIWHLDDPDQFAVFRKITESTKISEGDAFVSRVFATGQPVWIDNVTMHPMYSRANVTDQDIVVRAGFAIPITSQNKVVAVMEFYSDKVLVQDDKLMQSLVHIGVQLSRVAERTQAEVALRESELSLQDQVITLTDNEQRLEAQAMELVRLAEDLEVTRDELQRLNNQKDKFFSIIAHDLKSPFNALLAYSSMLATGVGGFEKDKIEEYSSAVNESAQRVFRLLENLLDWSRMQMGGLSFDPGPVELNTIIDDNVKLYEAIAKNKSVELNVRLKDQLVAFSDPHIVNTVIRNLINNAIKFTPEGGHVTVSAERNGEWANVFVIDTGVGMTSKKIEKLFDLGENTSTTGTAGEAGTGLGLQLCKDLAEKQGGQIHVESTEGKGSVFRFTLPLHLH